MARPTAFATGVYHLNVRVPSDLAARARGTRVTLPVGDMPTTVKVGDKVVVSLRTKDVATAKARFAAVLAALHRHWDALRSGPCTLTHRQVVALAGEAYRRRTAAFDAEPRFDPDALSKEAADHRDAVAAWKAGDGFGELSDAWAAFLADMQRPSGPQLYAYEHKCDIEDPYFATTYAEALEHLFGAEADALCAERQFQVDGATRAKLVRQIGEAVRLAGGRLTRTLDGDFSPDATLERFPAFERDEPATSLVPVAHGPKVTVEELFARWCAYYADKRAPSTARRYEPSVRSLTSFMKGKDVRQIDGDDLWAWAEHRRDVEGVAAKTVNRNDLVAAKSFFNFAATRDSDARPSVQKKVPLRSDNPV